jgi:hypothetical protein
MNDTKCGFENGIQVADRLNEKVTARFRMIAQGHVLKDMTAQGDASLLYNDYGFPADLVVG